jgi:hypothetical protein
VKGSPTSSESSEQPTISRTGPKRTTRTV